MKLLGEVTIEQTLLTLSAIAGLIASRWGVVKFIAKYFGIELNTTRKQVQDAQRQDSYERLLKIYARPVSEHKLLDELIDQEQRLYHIYTHNKGNDILTVIRTSWQKKVAKEILEKE